MSIRRAVYDAVERIKAKTLAVQPAAFTGHSQQEWDSFVAVSGVPRTCAHAQLETIPQTPLLHAVRAYMRLEVTQGKCLVLSGPTGIGKTYAAVAALRAWDTNSRRFVYFPTLCREVAAWDTRTEALMRAKHVRFLVLDDVGVEEPAGLARVSAEIDELMTYREGQRLPTILTTNLKPNELLLRYSDRIADRLRGSWVRMFVATGPSRRRQDPEPGGPDAA